MYTKSLAYENSSVIKRVKRLELVGERDADSVGVGKITTASWYDFSRGENWAQFF